MDTLMFSVFDSKAAVFGTPFFMPREAMAIRAFTDLVNDGRSMVSQHPEDFSLFKVGWFDDDKGVLHPSTHVNLCTASSLKKLEMRGMNPKYFESALPLSTAKPVLNDDVVEEVRR